MGPMDLDARAAVFIHDAAMAAVHDPDDRVIAMAGALVIACSQAEQPVQAIEAAIAGLDLARPSMERAAARRAARAAR